jgi:hypothetical protein
MTGNGNHTTYLWWFGDGLVLFYQQKKKKHTLEISINTINHSQMGGLWHCFTYISGFLLDFSMIFPSQTRRAALERGSRWGWAPPSTDSRPRCRKNLAATTFRVAQSKCVAVEATCFAIEKRTSVNHCLSWDTLKQLNLYKVVPHSI